MATKISGSNITQAVSVLVMILIGYYLVQASPNSTRKNVYDPVERKFVSKSQDEMFEDGDSSNVLKPADSLDPESPDDTNTRLQNKLTKILDDLGIDEDSFNYEYENEIEKACLFPKDPETGCGHNYVVDPNNKDCCKIPEGEAPNDEDAVSYTHLTLPTILRV